MAAVKLLEKIEAKDGSPMLKITRYSFKESGYESSEEAKVDFFLLIFRHSTEISKFSEFVDCAKYISSDRSAMLRFTYTTTKGIHT